jgi:hypothetical protein
MQNGRFHIPPLLRSALILRPSTPRRGDRDAFVAILLPRKERAKRLDLEKAGAPMAGFGSIVSLFNSLNDAIATSRNIAPTWADAARQFSFHPPTWEKAHRFHMCRGARRFENRFGIF